MNLHKVNIITYLDKGNVNFHYKANMNSYRNSNLQGWIETGVECASEALKPCFLHVGLKIQQISLYIQMIMDTGIHRIPDLFDNRKIREMGG